MKRLLIAAIILTLALPAQASWTGRDKVAHFLGSAYLCYWQRGLWQDAADLKQGKSITLAVSLTGILGAGKELSDKHLGTTGWSWEDLVYDCAGIAAGLILINNL